jgi:hypothetical protein
MYILVSGHQIAFTARLGSNGHDSENPLLFTRVITNVGSSYNPTTGKFTCAVPGTYIFSVSLTANNAYYVHAYIVKNGAVQLHVLTQQPGTSPSNRAPSASTQVVFRLVRGDAVWVRNHNGGYPLWEYSTFSGFLLYET